METVLEILKYTLPAIVVLVTAYLLVNAALNHITAKIELERRLGMQKDTLPLRLQAYERICLFLERISPPNLLLRINLQGKTSTVAQRQQALMFWKLTKSPILQHSR